MSLQNLKETEELKEILKNINSLKDDINDIENDHDEIKKNLLASYKLEVQNLVQHKKFLIIATDDEKKEYTDLLRELNDADS